MNSLEGKVEHILIGRKEEEKGLFSVLGYTGGRMKFVSWGVEAARVGADMVLQYTPGSAVGTPVRMRK